MSDIPIKLIAKNNLMTLFHHYYIERLAFCALIKHVLETDLQMDNFSFAKNFENFCLYAKRCS